MAKSHRNTESVAERFSCCLRREYRQPASSGTMSSPPARRASLCLSVSRPAAAAPESDVLVRWSLARLELRRHGLDEFADALGTTWLTADQDPAVRRWAAALGIEVGDVPPPRTPGARHTAWGQHGEWHIRPGEDRQLHHYWMKQRGTLWREVPVGGGDSKTRAIDAVLVPGDRPRLGKGPIPWDAPGLQVIEIKRRLTDTLIGQAAAAGPAAQEQGASQPERVALAVSVEPKDEPLKQVCDDLGLTLILDPVRSTVICVAVDPDDPVLMWLDQRVAGDELSDRGEALLAVARSVAESEANDARGRRDVAVGRSHPSSERIGRPY